MLTTISSKLVTQIRNSAASSAKHDTIPVAPVRTMLLMRTERMKTRLRVVAVLTESVGLPTATPAYPQTEIDMCHLD